MRFIKSLLLFFSAAVYLNILPIDICGIIARQKAYQICIFHIRPCSAHKRKLAAFIIIRIGVIGRADTSGRYAIHRNA